MTWHLFSEMGLIYTAMKIALCNSAPHHEKETNYGTPDNQNEG
jgi:hypothetical protein